MFDKTNKPTKASECNKSSQLFRAVFPAINPDLMHTTLHSPTLCCPSTTSSTKTLCHLPIRSVDLMMDMFVCFLSHVTFFKINSHATRHEKKRFRKFDLNLIKRRDGEHIKRFTRWLRKGASKRERDTQLTASIEDLDERF